MTGSLENYKKSLFLLCPTDNSYYSTPEFLHETAHIIAIFSIPTNLLGLYCVVFCTPSRMTEMKWCLFNIHLWIFLLDLNYLVFLIPFYFLPVPAYSFVGLFTKLGISSEFQYYFQIITGGGIAASMLLLFENRHHSIVPFTSSFRISNRYSRIFLFILNFCIGCPAIIPILVHPNNTEELKLEMLQILPCPNKLFFENCTFAVRKTKGSMSYVMSIGVVVIILEASFFVGHCVYHVFRWESSIGGLSTHARKMQRTFFIASCIQVAIPLSVLIIPTYYMTYGMMGIYSNQGLVNFLTLAQSLHGIVSTLSLLIVNKPYRDHIFGLFVDFRSTLRLIPSNIIKAIPESNSLRIK